MNVNDDLKVHTLTLLTEAYYRRIPLGKLRDASRPTFDLRVNEAGELFAQAAWKIYTHQVHEVEYPATWWDAVKQRWMPQWMYRWKWIKRPVIKKVSWTALWLGIPVCDDDRKSIKIHIKEGVKTWPT